HFGRTVYVFAQLPVGIVRVVEVHPHAVQEGGDQRIVDGVTVGRSSEGVDVGIGADTARRRTEVFVAELGQHAFLVVAVEGIHNLVGEPHETVNTVHGVADVPVETAHPYRERRAVTVGDQPACRDTYIVIHSLHIRHGLYFPIRPGAESAQSAAIFPEINAVGTPGPGAVICPV